LIFLLDTNVASELRKIKPHGALLNWYSNYPSDVFALPSITLYELQAGAEVTRRQDIGKAAEIERWIDALINETVILELDANAARQAARMMDRQSKALIEDALIAAIAKVHGLTIATRNTRDFERFGVPLVNPFTFKG
jgi:toxin FitB